MQQPDIQPKWNNRGIFTTGTDGRYSFVGIKPVSYPIPDDGPVGQMLGHLGRHPYRPAHMHYLVTGRGLSEGRDPHLRRRRSLPRLRHCVRREGDPRRALRAGRDGETVWRSPFDFVLTPVGEVR